MKIFSIILMLIFTVNTIAVAPYGLNGQNQSTTYPNVHQVPNKQVTNLGGINALIETGNNNLLENPSFEHATVQSGWTNSAGTIAAESSIVVHGKKSLKVTLSSQALDISQNSTLYQAQFADGVQGLASIKIKTAISGLRVCAQKAGAINSNLCVSVKSDNKWGYYKVPFILGGTSNGIEIDSNGVAVTGDVYFDEAFVGAYGLTADVPTVKSQYSLMESTATFTGNVTISGALTLTNGNGLYSYDSATGIYTALDDINVIMSVYCRTSTSTAGNCGIRISSGSIDDSQTFVQAANAFVSAAKTFYIQKGGTFSAQKGISTTSIDRANVSVLASKEVNTSIYSSNNADTDWEPVDNASSLITGSTTNPTFGTGVLSFFQKRQGSDLLLEIRFNQSTAGTAGSGTYEIDLPNGLTAKRQYAGADGQIVGVATLSLGTGTFLSGNGVQLVGNKLRIMQDNSTTGQSVWTSSSVYNFGTTNLRFSLIARIPIEGWENSNVIIGQFNGLESCTNTLECTDTFSARVDQTGVVSQENVDWINGNCSLSDTSLYACSFNTSIFTQNPNCTVSVVSTATTADITALFNGTPSSTAANIRTMSNTAKSAQVFELICQKQGADYIGKTAKAVASDQNLRSIGAIGVDVQSVVFAGAAIGTNCTTSPCIIYNSVGSKITSVTRNSTGDYNVNGIDGTKYICTSNANGSAYTSASHRRDLSTSSLARIQYGAAGIGAQDVNNSSVICIGVP